MFVHPSQSPSLRSLFAGFLLSSSFFIGTPIFAADPPATPAQTAQGADGVDDTITNVGSGTPISANWGNSGSHGNIGMDAETWVNPAALGQFNVDAANGLVGVMGGQAGRGGQGGLLHVGVSGNADFSGDYPVVLGAIGGNGGQGGKGGGGQDGGLGYMVGSLAAPQTQSVLDGGDGGRGGNGAAGVSGGDGGVLDFAQTSGNSQFSDGILFGGTGGFGGNGGNGGVGGIGGGGANSVGNFDDGNGGKGGDGGNGGKGGSGGKGGDAIFVLSSGQSSFSNATFGGKGGQGGNGGNAGAGGMFGIPGGLGGVAGTIGASGIQGDGGNGGHGGNGTIFIDGGVAYFSGTTYFGGDGGAAGTGKANGMVGNAGRGSLTIDSGRAELAGNLVFRGVGSSMSLAGGTLSYSGNRTIDLDTGTFTVAGGTTLNRTTATGVLTLKAGSIQGPTTGQILLDVQGEGQFLAANVTPNNLTTASFDLSNYRAGTEVVQSGNGFELVLGGGALPFEWTGGGDGQWKLGLGSDRANWNQPDFDFSTGDVAHFRGQGQGTVALVGLVNPGSVNISDGNYVFAGNGTLSGGAVNVNGNGTTLTLANSTANIFEQLNIGIGATVLTARMNTLGSGNVFNNGTLNLDVATEDELTNALTGDGSVQKTGAGRLVLTGNNSATGTLTVTAGTLQIGNGGTSGSYAGNIVSNTDVTFSRSDDSVYVGNLSGTGLLIKQGTGKLTLTGDNSGSAGLEIQGGSVISGSENALGNIATVKSDGTLDVNGMTQTARIELDGGLLANNSTEIVSLNNVALNASSKVGGSGNLVIGNVLTSAFGLEKIGTGTTTLTADNSYSGGTRVTEGTLKLELDGNVGGDIDVAENGRVLLNRNGSFLNDFDGEGLVDVQAGRNVTFNGSMETNLLVQNGAKITNTDIVVTNGKTLEITAAKDADDASLQGGSLTLDSGATIVTNFIDYEIKAGEEVPIYLGNDLTSYADGGATMETVQQKLLYKISDIQYKNGDLFYVVKRRFAAEMFPNVSPTIGPVVDSYSDGNAFFEELLNLDSDAAAERHLQSGFDFVGLAHGMSAVYDAKRGVGQVLENRMLESVRKAPTACEPCGSFLGQSQNTKREAWVSSLYENVRGFRLRSGSFKYGYTNDLYGIAFGVDQTSGTARAGVMGIGGESHLVASGNIIGTKNEISYGGVYGYLNEKTVLGNLFVHAGWLGMKSDVRQFGAEMSDAVLKGEMNGGLASVTMNVSETFCVGGVHVTPIIGIEYGYFYQDGSGVTMGNAEVFTNEKSHANLVTMPVGFKISRKTQLRGGVLTPEIRAKYIGNLANVTAHYRTFATGSRIPATMTSVMSDRHAGEVGLGFEWRRGRRALSGDYSYMFSDKQGGQSASLTGSWRF